MSENQNIIQKVIYFFNSKKIPLILAGIAIILIIFLQVSHEKPTTLSGMLRKAETYEENGKIAFALEEYNKIARLYPRNYEVHLRLGDLYRDLDSIEKAKVEYIRAIKYSPRSRHEAVISLAKIYRNENRYDIMEDIIKLVENSRNREVNEELGNLYYDWGAFLTDRDRLEAIRKFKKAYNYYQKAGSKESKETLRQIDNLYADISDTLLEENETKKAEEILQLSISYKDNALAHYKLAKIYEKQNKAEKALDEYEKAYKLDSIPRYRSAYASFLTQQSEVMEKKGEITKSKLYAIKARRLNPKQKALLVPEINILFNLVATKVNEDISKDVITPGVIFKINNISKNIINYLKVKIIFIKDGKPLDEQIMILADDENYIPGDSITPDISVYSKQPVKNIFDEHNLEAKVYISQTSPDNWKLYRYLDIRTRRSNDFLLINQ